MKFKIGDKVMLTEADCFDSIFGIKVGDVGVVIDEDDTPYVKFERVN